MLEKIHQKLKKTSCPNCQSVGSLEALLVCSREEKQCRTACQCSNCSSHFVINVPSDAQSIDTKVISCDIVSRECSFQETTPQAA